MMGKWNEERVEIERLQVRLDEALAERDSLRVLDLTCCNQVAKVPSWGWYKMRPSAPV